MAPKSRRVPQELRQRTEKSCDRCKSRKQKCGMVPGQDKCAHCVKYGYECLVTKPRKQRLYGSVEAHAERLVLLEGLVKHFVPDADLANPDGVKELARSLADDATEAGADRGSSRAGNSSSSNNTLVKANKDTEMLVRDLQGQGQYIGQASSFFFQVRLRDALETWIGRDSGSAGSPSSTGTPGRMLLFGPNPADANRRGSGVHGGYRFGESISDVDGMHDAVDLVPSDHHVGHHVGHVDHYNLDGPSLTLCLPLALADLLPSLPAAERWTVTQLLVRTFFDRINNDFPVLHEATFLEQLGAWSRRPQEADQAWVCTLLCVLMLAWRLVAPASVAAGASARGAEATSSSAAGPGLASSTPAVVALHELQEARWWHQAQALLPKVLFTSSTTSVQALMLTALHLHNNNSRDVCWTLTGAAVRIGFAIGLHRDDVVETPPLAAAEATPSTTATGAAGATGMTPVSRELRKRVWWTLYAFEQLQVSSHDRPSAIDSTKHLLAGTPRETILDMGAHNPPEYVVWANRLVALLGAACRTLPDTAQPDEASATAKIGQLMGPLSPAAGLLRDLARWSSTLPRHLSADLIDAMPPSFKRPLLLLHVQHNYVAALVSRYALLSRFTAVSKRAPLVDPVRSMSDVCIQSGRHSCELLLKLDAIGGFNALTWMDVYYLYSSVLIVVLALVCEASQKTKEPSAPSELRQLLARCKTLAAKHLANPVVPGTMRRWLTVVGELHVMAGNFVTQRRSDAVPTGPDDVPKQSSTHEGGVAADDASPTQIPPLMASPDDGVEAVPRPVYYGNDYSSYSSAGSAGNGNSSGARRNSQRSRQTDRRHPHYHNNNTHHHRRVRGDSRGSNTHLAHHTQQPLLPTPLSLAGLATDTAMPAFTGDSGRQLMLSSAAAATSGAEMDVAAADNGFFLTSAIADPATVAAAAAAHTALDADDYGPFQAAADAAEAGMWHEMHWEGISDLLLGVEPRSWNA